MDADIDYLIDYLDLALWMIRTGEVTRDSRYLPGVARV